VSALLKSSKNPIRMKATVLPINRLSSACVASTASNSSPCEHARLDAATW
jgi:hypothetical protein